LQKFITNFTDAFLGDSNKKTVKNKTAKNKTASDVVYKDIMENVFNLDYADTNGKIRLSDIKGTFVSPILDILYALITYLSEERTVKAGVVLIPIKDKNNAILLFMIMFTQFTLNQGGAIVTSLEHLLFEFLNQIPDGIDKFNTTKGQTRKPFEILEGLEGKYYKYRTFTESSSSGMTETVTSEYLQGMHNVLNIGENSRFINLLTILRRKDDEIDTNKRCQGARDTLEFGKTLVQANEKLCGVKGALKGKDSDTRDKLESLLELKNNIDAFKSKPLTGSIISKSNDLVIEQFKELNLVSDSKKYRRNKNGDEGCTLM